MKKRKQLGDNIVDFLNITKIKTIYLKSYGKFTRSCSDGEELISNGLGFSTRPIDHLYFYLFFKRRKNEYYLNIEGFTFYTFLSDIEKSVNIFTQIFKEGEIKRIEFNIKYNVLDIMSISEEDSSSDIRKRFLDCMIKNGWKNEDDYLVLSL